MEMESKPGLMAASMWGCGRGIWQMGEEGWTTQMEMSTKASGKTTKLMDKESISTATELDMMASGWMTSSMDLVSSSGLMVLFTKGAM